MTTEQLINTIDSANWNIDKWSLYNSTFEFTYCPDSVCIIVGIYYTMPCVYSDSAKLSFIGEYSKPSYAKYMKSFHIYKLTFIIFILL